ncbi:MAG: Planctomycete cytochrome [Planctomycetaceae bacterium]|nr:Planctomycete cytochrome [Planctomycetaceae bacterium]
MPRFGLPSILLTCCVLSFFENNTQAAETPPEVLTYEQHVWPILRAHCFDCHGAEEAKKGNLDLRLVRFMQTGGDTGPALTPGKPAESLIVERIRKGQMPPGEAKVSAAELQIIEKWVAQGARTVRPEPESIPPGLGIIPEEREFWSFRPIIRPAVPPHAANEQVRNPIDAFLLAEMKPAGLTFSPEASKLTLLRRAYFDLLGLPPTPAEVEQFLADDSPGAYDRMVNELLDSPRYGERWGRHWLDIAGYADSEGSSNEDPVRPNAYKYRDYVIRAFNADKPFDRFIVEQLAGDELVPLPHANLNPEQIDLLTATGFLRMAADGTASGGGDADLMRNQVISDTLKIVSTSLLGLSVGCAQCHDHRYDPIPQTDYFRLRAIFEPALDWKHWRAPAQRQISLYTDADRTKATEIEAEAQKIAAERAVKQTQYLAAALEIELKKHPEELREALKAACNTPADKRTPEQQKLLTERPSVNISPGNLYQYDAKAAEDLKQFDARITDVRSKKPVEDFLRVLNEVPGQASPTFLFYRGDHRQPKGEISPGDLTVAAPQGERLEIPLDDPSLPTTGRRLAYARWLTNGKHPLLARVIANRVWMHHFGRGIVGTPADFGKLGERPTHPALLNWLASEFMQQGWSLKQLHRTMLLSTAYRQSSRRDATRDAVDADNRFVSRMPVRRLDAEIVRDRILMASGSLTSAMFGTPVAVKADDAGQIIVDGGDARRSIYIQSRRSQPVAVLTAFDAPVMEVNCERRPASTVATQSLMLMNSDFMLQQAKLLADRVLREAASEPPPALPADTVLPAPLPLIWQYGYGRFDESTNRMAGFDPLPHFTGSAWQGGAQLPDPTLGWAILHAAGGHAGNDLQHAPTRRWTAPRDGFVTITGKLHHPSENGDGVRGRLVSSRTGRISEWIATHSTVDTNSERIEIQKGETLDFVVDCRESVTSDSFEWIVQLRLQDASNAIKGIWNSQSDFHGPQAVTGPPLPQQVQRAWRLAYGRTATPEELMSGLRFLARQIDQQRIQPVSKVAPEQQALIDLCQALLSSNEFLYVD